MTPPGVHALLVPPDAAAQRVDRYVADVTGLSRSHVQKLITAGNLTADGVPIKANAVIGPGASLQLVVPEPEPLDLTPEPDIAVHVVYEDPDLLIIDKPAGLVVHPSPGHSSGTLVNALLGLAGGGGCGGIAGVQRPGIVHRLDVGTSGLLAVARTQRAYHELVDALSSRDVGRVYLALVWGHPANANGVIDAPIGRDHRDPQRMAVVVDGKPARTRYTVLHGYRSPALASLIECRLESGRTHQIRVHLSAIGHPVVGDATYGGLRPGIDSPRPFLHAAKLELAHPVSRETLVFESPLPADLADVLSTLRES